MKRWDSHTSAIACMSSSRSVANWRVKSSIGTGWRVAFREVSVTWTWYNPTWPGMEAGGWIVVGRVWR